MNSIVNVNLETGIHFGVTNGNEASELNEDWFDLFEPVYYDENGNKITEFPDDGSLDDLENETYICDKPNFKAQYNNNTNIMMIFFSKKIVKCRYCSPCYPNAGDLGSLDENGIDTYALND